MHCENMLLHCTKNKLKQEWVCHMASPGLISCWIAHVAFRSWMLHVNIGQLGSLATHQHRQKAVSATICRSDLFGQMQCRSSAKNALPLHSSSTTVSLDKRVPHTLAAALCFDYCGRPLGYKPHLCDYAHAPVLSSSLTLLPVAVVAYQHHTRFKLTPGAEEDHGRLG